MTVKVARAFAGRFRLGLGAPHSLMFLAKRPRGNLAKPETGERPCAPRGIFGSLASGPFFGTQLVQLIKS